MPENYLIALLLTLFAGLATVLGGLFTFAVKKNNLKVLSVGLGFSAGVMIYLSLTEILTGANELLQKVFPSHFEWLVFAGFLTGIIVAVLIDYFVPDHIEENINDIENECSHKHRIKRAGLLTALAIGIHNFPEGMATFLVSSNDLTLGISVAIAIALHNIPEGIAIAMPIYHATGKKRSAIKYSFFAGISEPIGAVIGLGILKLILPEILVGYLFAAVAGIMIYISFDTLLPLAKEYGDWHYSITGIIGGILIIWLSLLIIG